MIPGDDPIGDPTWLVCPQCLTVCRGAEPACLRCQFPFAWLDQFVTFRDALQLRPQTSKELHLEAGWPGGETELRRPWDTPLSLATGEERPWEFRVAESTFELVVTHARNSWQFALPCQARVGGMSIAARLLAVPVRRPVPTGIDRYSPELIPLRTPTGVIVGRERSPDVHEVADADISKRHCVLVHQPDTGNAWIADLASSTGTFVNRVSVTVARLNGGDFVQAGKHAWTFNESDGLLVPVRPIAGIDLRLEDVARKGRLLPLDLHVPAGQLIAVAGASGAGKSTLMTALLGKPHSRTRGRITAGGFDCDHDRDSYRSCLGYVSQQDVVHADLRAQEAIEFGAQLRGKRIHAEQVEELFRRLDLQSELWQKTPGSMSGGESQRVRIAAELIAGPRLLLLDEPARGLDQGREIALMTLLRGLSLQGCTIVVITHGLRHLDGFDRVLIFEKTRPGGRLRFDGSPRELQQQIESHDFSDLDLTNTPEQLTARQLPPAPHPQATANKTGIRAAISSFRDDLPQLCDQFHVLFRRELAIVSNCKFRRLVLPLLILPAIFALTIGIAVPADDRPLLGFFAILAVIWMGASLSLMCIVSERAVLEHEHLLFLRLVPYIQAKIAVLWLFSAIQTTAFLLMLTLLRDVAYEDAVLYRVGWVAFYLLSVGWAAVGMGMVISAMSGDRPVVANFILPLVMMVQIVFSVQVAGQGQQQVAVDLTYGEFNARYCQGRQGCPRRAKYYVPDVGAFLCNDCKWALEQAGKNDQMQLPSQSREALKRVQQQQSRESPADDSVVKYNGSRPNANAARASFFTLTRYGDMALRCFAYEAAPQSDGTAYWKFGALLILLTMAVGFPALTAFLLWWQTTGKSHAWQQFLFDQLSGTGGHWQLTSLQRRLEKWCGRAKISGRDPSTTGGNDRHGE